MPHSIRDRDVFYGSITERIIINIYYTIWNSVLSVCFADRIGKQGCHIFVKKDTIFRGIGGVFLRYNIFNQASAKMKSSIAAAYTYNFFWN